MDRVERIDKLVGRAVVSLETANKLGQISDLLIDAISGKLAGLVVTRPLDNSEALVSDRDIRGLGPDAIVVEADHSMVLSAASPLNTLTRAKGNLIGVKVLTDHGQLLGNIANIFICYDQRPVFLYEVRSSFIDKLLGRAFYFAAARGCAFSDDKSALVIAGDPEQMDNCLEAAAERLLGDYKSAISPSNAVHVEVRSHAH